VPELQDDFGEAQREDNEGIGHNFEFGPMAVEGGPTASDRLSGAAKQSEAAQSGKIARSVVRKTSMSCISPNKAIGIIENAFDFLTSDRKSLRKSRHTTRQENPNAMTRRRESG